MAKCKICHKTYSTLSSAKRHERETHGPKKICPYCFRFYGRLNSHLSCCKKFHRYLLDKVKIVNGNLLFVDSKSSSTLTNPSKKLKSNMKKFNNYQRINFSDFYFSPKMKLGEGSFCNVFSGFNKKTGKECAVKFFKNKSEDFENLKMEEHMLKNLKGIISFPSLYYSSHKNLILIESLHGPNLKKLFLFCNKNFPLKTICYIGIEMINRIQEFHSRGFIHRDVKPSNFAWGKFDENTNELRNHILLLDYDLAGIYRTNESSHILFQKDEKIVGNLTFKSLAANYFITQTRRDDLESILYCLIYFFNGKLPWERENINIVYKRLNKKLLRKKSLNEKERESLIPKERIFLEFKKRIPVKKLCEGLPTEFEILLTYCRDMTFQEEPDYELMKDLLKRVILNNSNNLEGDYKYIWEKKLVDILNYPDDLRKIELNQIKSQLFSGFNINLVKFIKSLKRLNLINFKLLNK